MRLTPLVTVTLALCTVAGCASSGGGASAPPPAVVTPSTQPSMQAAPPAVPAPNTPATGEGAIAFVRAYYAEHEPRSIHQRRRRPSTSLFDGNCPCRTVSGEIVAQQRDAGPTLDTALQSNRFGSRSEVKSRLTLKLSWPATGREHELVDSRIESSARDPGHSANRTIRLDRMSSNRGRSRSSTASTKSPHEGRSSCR